MIYYIVKECIHGHSVQSYFISLLCYLFSDAECAEAFSGVSIQMFLGFFFDVTVHLRLICTGEQQTHIYNIKEL